MGDEEEKRAIAFATLLGLGLGAYYLLKDDLKDVWEPPEKIEKRDVVEEKREEAGKSNVLKDKEQKMGERGDVEEIHDVQWGDLQNLLGQSYPGNDLLKIYMLMSPSQRDMWRRGIYRYGARSKLDKHFVYYDSYYLGRYGNRDLYYAYYWYSRGRIGFDSLLQRYLEVISKRVDV